MGQDRQKARKVQKMGKVAEKGTKAVPAKAQGQRLVGKKVPAKAAKE